MSEEELCPLRVEQVLSVAQQEWRPGEKLPPYLCENWQLVYVLSGAVEETADLRRIALGRGWVYFHQPGEAAGMRAVGDIPPEVMRVDFVCSSAVMDEFRGLSLHTDTNERIYLHYAGVAAREVFSAPKTPDEAPRRRAEPPFAAQQQLQITLELALIAMVRRMRGGQKASARARREQSSAVLLETVRRYFAARLDCDLTVEQVCRDNGCTRARLQKVFRTRTKCGAMEYFARMKVERAKDLLEEGYSPGETAQRLGYSSGAYFSRSFKKLAGCTPHEYQAEHVRK